MPNVHTNEVDDETLIRLITNYVERNRYTTNVQAHHNRVTFDTTGETAGVPSDLLTKIADCGATLSGSGGNSYSARIR